MKGNIELEQVRVADSLSFGEFRQLYILGLDFSLKLSYFPKFAVLMRVTFPISEG